MEKIKFDEANKVSPEIQTAKDKLNALQLKFVREHNIELLSKLQNELFVFAKKLRKAFPDYKEYSAYHRVLGGSGMDSKPEFLDFEGEDDEGNSYSVIKFVDNLEKKITEAK